MSVRTPILTTSSDISAEAVGVEANDNSVAARAPATFMFPVNILVPPVTNRALAVSLAWSLTRPAGLLCIHSMEAVNAARWRQELHRSILLYNSGLFQYIGGSWFQKAL
jgi:hypothetical protein